MVTRKARSGSARHTGIQDIEKQVAPNVQSGAFYPDSTGNPKFKSPEKGEVDLTPSEGGAIILSSISAGTFIYPGENITNPFSNAANSPNIMPNVDNYPVRVDLLSTSSNEPRQLPDLDKIPLGTINLKFRSVYLPETGNSWNSETIIWKGEFKKMTDNVAWSSVTAFDIGTDTMPSSGSAPQLYEATVSLATLGLAVGDMVIMVVFVDSTSTWAHDVAAGLFQIEVA